MDYRAPTDWISLEEAKKWRHFKFDVEITGLYHGEVITKKLTSIEYHHVRDKGPNVYEIYKKNDKDRELWNMDLAFKDHDAASHGLTYDRKYQIYHTFSEVTSFRVKLKGIDKYNSVINDVEVGDFVQFSGQRDKSSWRKIISINLDSGWIFSEKYTHPINDDKYRALNSSENGIYTLINLVKNTLV